MFDHVGDDDGVVSSSVECDPQIETVEVADDELARMAPRGFGHRHVNLDGVDLAGERLDSNREKYPLAGPSSRTRAPRGTHSASIDSEDSFSAATSRSYR